MADFSAKNRLVTAKLEDPFGTDASPTVGANAIRMTSIEPGLNLETLAIESETGALDNNEQAANGGFIAPNLSAILRGSGVAGTAPDYSPLLQSCAMGLTTLGTAETGTAQAGGASTITLAAATVGTDNEFRGMIIELTGGTGYSASNFKQNRRVIAGTVASTQVATVYPAWAVEPDNTTTYSIAVCNRFAPISTSIPGSTIDLIDRNSTGGNARRYKSIGSRGSFGLNLPTRGTGTLTFGMRGALQAPDDLSDPGDPTLQDSRPQSWMNAQTYLGAPSLCMGAFTLDMAGEIVVTQCQNEIYGYENAVINSRRFAGTINPRAVNIATRDVFAAWAAQSSVQFWTSFGTTAGNRISIYIPQLIYGSVNPQTIDGLIHDQINYLVGGQNDNVFITFF